MKSKATGIQLIDHNDDEIWDLKIKPMRDAEGKILSGLVVGQTLEQTISSVLVAHPGEFKFEPTVGVGLQDSLLAEGKDFLAYKHRIVEDLRKDGLTVKRLVFDELNEFLIEAEYE